jgi:hypothetical protein
MLLQLVYKLAACNNTERRTYLVKAIHHVMTTGHVWNLEGEGDDKVQELYCLRKEQRVDVMRIERESEFWNYNLKLKTLSIKRDSHG